MTKFSTEECLDIQVRGKLDVITMDLNQAAFIAHIDVKFYEEKVSEYPDDRYFKAAYDHAKSSYAEIDKLRDEIQSHITDIRVYLTDPSKAKKDWDNWMGNYDKRTGKDNIEVIKC